MQPYHPGRYAAIEIGTNCVLLLVADLDEEGRLTPVAEGARTTRLGERFYVGSRLVRSARERTLQAICEAMRIARRAGAESIAAVGTSVLREAPNRAEFEHEVRQECGLPIEIISGEQEAELLYVGNWCDRRLPATDGERVVLDVGGGSSQLVRGLGGTILSRATYPVGCARLTELYLKSDPPGVGEYLAADGALEQALSEVEPPAPGSLILAAGGTVVALAAVARASGMISAREIHGCVLPHGRVSELVELFRSLPVRFRKRVPGLEPERADMILAGALILHQFMARLSAVQVVVTTSGVRHGCIYSIARRARLPL